MMGNSNIIATSSRLVRYEKVFRTLVKYGFEDLLSHPPFSKLVPQTNLLVPKRKGKKVSQYSRYERIRMAFEELGTTFIKFAQIASNRPDLLPEKLIFELEKLQDRVPPVPIKEIHKVLEASLPRPLNELVEYFDEKPLASASMAQVHRARLLGGQEVILKIQRPTIKKTIATDISILKNITSIIHKNFPKLEIYQPEELVRMFENSIEDELDFQLEAKNLLHFHKMFDGKKDVYIPEFYPELSTQNILCMEYIEGYKITDLEQLKQFNISGKDLAKRGIGLYFEQIFEHGFFHADPHPGNIFVLKTGEIVFLDYGMMGTVTKENQFTFAKMLLSIYEKDADGLKQSILKFSSGLDQQKEAELELDILTFFRNYTDVSIENIDGNEIMKAINSLFFDYKIKIPSGLLLLLKALIIIEGVGLKLDPEYDMIDNIGPFAKELMTKRFDLGEIQKSTMNSIEEIANLIRDFPEDTRAIIQKIKQGKLHIELEHQGLEAFSHNIDVNVNRLSFTFLTIAILISSSIIINAKIPPIVYNISLLGLVGISISALLSIRLLYAILKTGKI